VTDETGETEEGEKDAEDKEVDGWNKYKEALLLVEHEQNKLRNKLIKND